MTEQATTPFVSQEASRRTVLKTAGLVVAGGGLGALAGCSQDGGAAPATNPSTTKAGGGGAATIAKAEVPVGGGAILTDADYVVTQPTEGEFKAFSKLCTHQGCAVTSVTDGSIVCPCHRSSFSVTDGSVLSGPAEQPLPAKTVTVQGDQLTISG